jgi:benzoyl-CoA reductase/2-hydroxyglutaryl-CoA dehydratase subunit BcrC/BadD/HgdB
MMTPANSHVGFACAYTPLPLIAAAGFVPFRLLPMTQVPDRSGRILHDNLCPHIKAILDRAMAGDLPSPASSRDLNNFGIVMALFLGSDGSVEVAEAYRDAFRESIAAGRSGVPNEKIRLLWIQNRMQFRHPLEKMLENDYGAAIVIDELNDFNWAPIDPDEPFEGLARRSIAIPFNGTIATRVEHLQKLAREYRVHGAINPCNWGCRQGTGARGLIEAGLGKIGVPVLNLEVDCVDDRKFTEGQLRTRLEAFLEMLEGRPSPW